MTPVCKLIYRTTIVLLLAHSLVS